MSLKELTKQAHSDAERSEFAKLLMSGNINEKQYATYLYQMLEVYIVLEHLAAKEGFLKDLPGLSRVTGIKADLQELGYRAMSMTAFDSTRNYIKYLLELVEDQERKHLILAHLYVRHMGDLYGGQMIAKRVPGSGKFYDFQNKDLLITRIREKLTDDLSDEANVAFEHAINIMRELNEWNLEQTN